MAYNRSFSSFFQPQARPQPDVLRMPVGAPMQRPRPDILSQPIGAPMQRPHHDVLRMPPTQMQAPPPRVQGEEFNRPMPQQRPQQNPQAALGMPPRSYGSMPIRQVSGPLAQRQQFNSRIRSQSNPQQMLGMPPRGYGMGAMGMGYPSMQMRSPYGMQMRNPYQMGGMGMRSPYGMGSPYGMLGMPPMGYGGMGMRSPYGMQMRNPYMMQQRPRPQQNPQPQQQRPQPQQQRDRIREHLRRGDLPINHTDVYRQDKDYRQDFEDTRDERKQSDRRQYKRNKWISQRDAIKSGPDYKILKSARKKAKDDKIAKAKAEAEARKEERRRVKSTPEYKKAREEKKRMYAEEQAKNMAKRRARGEKIDTTKIISDDKLKEEERKRDKRRQQEDRDNISVADRRRNRIKEMDDIHKKALDARANYEKYKDLYRGSKNTKYKDLYKKYLDKFMEIEGLTPEEYDEVSSR